MINSPLLLFFLNFTATAPLPFHCNYLACSGSCSYTKCHWALALIFHKPPFSLQVDICTIHQWNYLNVSCMVLHIQPSYLHSLHEQLPVLVWSWIYYFFLFFCKCKPSADLKSWSQNCKVSNHSDWWEISTATLCQGQSSFTVSNNRSSLSASCLVGQENHRGDVRTCYRSSLCPAVHCRVI